MGQPNSAEDFMHQVQSLVHANGRHLSVWCPSLLGSHSTVIVELINLPTSESTQGAQAENNKVRLTVSGFDAKDPSAPAPRGKVEVELRIWSLFSPTGQFLPTQKLRKKTAPPAQAAKYVAAYMNKMIAENEPYFSDAKYKKMAARVARRFKAASV